MYIITDIMHIVCFLVNDQHGIEIALIVNACAFHPIGNQIIPIAVTNGNNNTE